MAAAKKILKIRHSNFLEACTKNALVWNALEECPDHSPPFSNSYNFATICPSWRNLNLFGALSVLKWFMLVS